MEIRCREWLAGLWLCPVPEPVVPDDLCGDSRAPGVPRGGVLEHHLRGSATFGCPASGCLGDIVYSSSPAAGGQAVSSVAPRSASSFCTSTSSMYGSRATTTGVRIVFGMDGMRPAGHGLTGATARHITMRTAGMEHGVVGSQPPTIATITTAGVFSTFPAASSACAQLVASESFPFGEVRCDRFASLPFTITRYQAIVAQEPSTVSPSLRIARDDRCRKS